MKEFYHSETFSKNIFKNFINAKYFKPYFVIIFGILILALFFRGALIFSDKAIFDEWDGLIALSQTHHWYNVFRGIENWKTLGYFYPYHNTLGYCEGFLIYGIFYSFFSALKFNPFIAFEMAIVVIRAMGFYSFFYLCYKKLDLNFYVSLLSSAVFTLSGIAYLQSGHTQLLCVSLAPLLTIFLLNYFEKLFIKPNALKAVFWGTIAGLFYVLWLFSCFYMAWFFTLFACILLFTLLCFKYFYKIPLKKPNYFSIILPVIFTLIPLLAFLRVYLPIGFKAGMQPFNSALYYTPHLKDIFNISNQNLIWGHFINYFKFEGGEFTVGFSLLFLVILVLAINYSIRSFFRSPKIEYKNSVFWLSLSLAIIISIFLSLKISSFTLWYLVWKFVPGGNGLRVVARYWIFLVFPMCILIAYFLSNKVNKMGYLLRFLLFSVLFLEQIESFYTSNLSIKNQMEFLDTVKNFPAQCQSFFVVGNRYSENQLQNNPVYWNNVDAFFISEFIGLRTINGFNTFNPPDWNFSYEPTANYLERIKEYVINHKIEKNLCLLDIKERKWRLIDDISNLN